MLYFLHSTSVPSFHIHVAILVLPLSLWHWHSWCFSPLYHSWVWVDYEYKKFCTQIQWVRVPSTSIPALDERNGTGNQVSTPGATDYCLCDNLWTTSSISCRIDRPHQQNTWLDFGWFPLWLWSLIFKVKYGICHISTKNGLIAMKQKTIISIELWASNGIIGFNLDQDLDLEF